MATMGRGLVALLLLVVLLLGTTVRGDVVTLTDSTFTDKIKEKDTVWFVKFFAPWCGHCKKLAPTWEDLGKSLEGEDGVEIGRMDCTMQKTCSSVDIRSYPTLKIFYNGEDMKKPYTGPRDLQSLKKFVLEAASELLEEDGEAATI